MTDLIIRFAGLGAIDMSQDPPLVVFPLCREAQSSSQSGETICAHFLDVFFREKFLQRLTAPGLLEIDTDANGPLDKPTIAFKNWVLNLDTLCDYSMRSGYGGAHVEVAVPGGSLDVANDDENRTSIEFIDSPAAFPAKAVRALSCEVKLALTEPRFSIRSEELNTTQTVQSGDVLEICNHPEPGHRVKGEPNRDFEIFYRMIAPAPSPMPVPLLQGGITILSPGNHCVPFVKI